MGESHFGFLKYKYKGMSYRPVEERVSDFKEISCPRSGGEVREQAERCMNCGIPFCHMVGCPLKNLIPEWNLLVSEGNWREAYRRLQVTSTFSEFTGRICPAPCESACTLALNDSPVSIRQIELAIVEKAWTEGWVTLTPGPDTGQRVAVVGSGPAGLAAAQDLRLYGHEVVVHEKSDRVGGLLRYGIPDYKLDKEVIDRRLRLMSEAGIQFRTGVNVGAEPTLPDLRREFDAVVLACGAEHPIDYVVEGRDAEGVHWAMEYLVQVNRRNGNIAVHDDEINVSGKDVLVLGAGDTGSDCIGSARREGAARILQSSRRPEPAEWREDRNPSWPDVPLKKDFLEVSSSHQEGCERLWSCVPTKFHSDSEGKLCGVTFVKVRWNQVPGDSGKKPSMELLYEDSWYQKIDLVLLAVGFDHTAEGPLLEQLRAERFEFDEWGNPLPQQTGTPDLFLAGDMVHGASLVVDAIAQGREAASSVQDFLVRKSGL